MLPNIDVTAASGVGGSTPVKKPDSDPVVQEPRKTNREAPSDNTYASTPSGNKVSGADDVAATRSATATAKTRSEAKQGTTRIYNRPESVDKAEINFQVTREERAVFLNAMSGEEDPAEMTQEEQATLQKVSERLQKLIEEAAARDSDRGERLEKAVKEWYNRLSNGKRKAPADLVRLINKAALGIADLSKID